MDGDFLVEFGDEEGLFLDVDLAAACARGVKLGRADAVGVPATDAGSFSCDVADLCHNAAHGTIVRTSMQPFDAFFVVIVVVFSAIIHEVMHGVAAEWLGDKTARYAGRLTLNPLPHLDPFGSVLLPIILTLTNSPIFFAWAKPVPYNPYNLRADGLFGRFNEAIVAGAGPLSNLVIAVLFGAIIRIGFLPPETNALLFYVVLINTMLFLFNLIPIPPLDGSKVIESLLPRSLQNAYFNWRRMMEVNPFFGMGLVLVVILILGDAFGGVVYTLARMVAGG